MVRYQQVAKVCLWLFVMILGLSIGAGLYETCVVTPLWAGSPPESVWGWNADPRYAIRSFEKFWRFVTPALGLTAFVALLSGFKTGPTHRKWRFFSAGMSILIVAVTYLYFIPARDELFASESLGITADAVAAKTHQWIALNWARGAAYFLAWLAGLRALSTSAKDF